jgi:hypothetical protein
VAAALAMLPYAWALALWMAVTLAAYLAVIRAILPRPETLLIALAFPAVFVNLGHGQNGFLTAALLGGALLLLDARPVWAGVLVGLMAYKPQFALLIPLVLVATRRWTVLAAAALMTVAMSLATAMLFGWQIWSDFLASSEFTRRVVLEQGNTGWEKIQSLFSAVRMWGGGTALAYAAQFGLGLAVAGTTIWLWRSKASNDLKAAALACGCLLITPYLLDYDLVALAVALAFFARHGLAHGFRGHEISCLALVWAAPLLARTVAGGIGLPLGLLTLLALYALIVRRAVLDLGLFSAALRPVGAAAKP